MPRRSPRAPAPAARPGALATSLTALALTAPALAACTPADPAVPTSTTPTTPTASPTASGSRAPTSPAPGVRVAVTAGDVALEVIVPGGAPDDPVVHVSPGPGATTVELEAVAPDPGRDAAEHPRVALVSGGTLVPNADGSVTVRGGGAAVGGLTAPRGARFEALDDTHLRVRAAGDGAGGAVATSLGTEAVARADWGEREGGRSLAVEPTGWAREAGRAGADVAWSQLVAADPEVDTPTMRDQLECHAIGARDKDTWNLEPWRPDVGLVTTLAARCNPLP